MSGCGRREGFLAPLHAEMQEDLIGDVGGMKGIGRHEIGSLRDEEGPASSRSVTRP